MQRNLEDKGSDPLIESSFLKALQIICQRLSQCQSHWVVTGSVGMALQGMDITIQDIDLQTDEQGAYEIEDLLKKFVTDPVQYKTSERVRSHIGILEINNIKIEIMGCLQKKLADQTWEDPIRVKEHQKWVECSGMKIPVLSLAYEYQAYLKLGRHEKAEKIKRWLTKGE